MAVTLQYVHNFGRILALARANEYRRADSKVPDDAHVTGYVRGCNHVRGARRQPSSTNFFHGTTIRTSQNLPQETLRAGHSKGVSSQDMLAMQPSPILCGTRNNASSVGGLVNATTSQMRWTMVS